MNFKSPIDIVQIVTICSLLIAVVTFILKEWLISRRNLRTANREIYQKLEFASIDLFRFDASGSQLPGILWADDLPIPPEGSAQRYAYLNYVCQILNLFEMSVRFRKEKIMPPEIFGSWVIWYFDLCNRDNFIPIWKEVRLNYTCDLRRIMDKGIEIVEGDLKEEDQRKRFFEFVAEELNNCKYVKEWLLCGQNGKREAICKGCPSLYSSAERNDVPVPEVSKIKIEWCKDIEQIRLMASFFEENVNIPYISHYEVQYGRALDFTKWRGDIKEFIFKEFRDNILLATELTKKYRLAMAHNNGEVVGLVFLTINNAGPVPFLEINDFLVHKNMRHRGIGSLILKWIEAELSATDVRRIFLESGIHNKNAHRFFERNGYNTCSKIMVKEIY